MADQARPWLSRNEVRVGDLRTNTPERARTVWVRVELQYPATCRWT